MRHLLIHRRKLAYKSKARALMIHKERERERRGEKTTHKSQLTAFYSCLILICAIFHIDNDNNNDHINVIIIIIIVWTHVKKKKETEWMIVEDASELMAAVAKSARSSTQYKMQINVIYTSYGSINLMIWTVCKTIVPRAEAIRWTRFVLCG